MALTYSIILRQLGSGAVLCAVQALQIFIAKHPHTKIYTEYKELLEGYPLMKGVVRAWAGLTYKEFNNSIKHSNIIIPKPYLVPKYYRGEAHMSEAFNFILNNTYKFASRSINTKVPKNILSRADGWAKFAKIPKDYVVIQPFGSRLDPSTFEDPTYRSISVNLLQRIIEPINAQNMGIVYMGTALLPKEWPIIQSPAPAELWRGIISNARYFIGCDSLGQHIAYQTRTPGTVIFGTSSSSNVGYSEHFNIVESEKHQSPVPLGILPDIEVQRACMANKYLIDDVDNYAVSSILNHMEEIEWQ